LQDDDSKDKTDFPDDAHMLASRIPYDGLEFGDYLGCKCAKRTMIVERMAKTSMMASGNMMVKRIRMLKRAIVIE